jgi:dTDP-4-amino-4,6-dideoxygalactose transaminase
MVIARRDEDLARIKTLSLHGLSRDAWKRFGSEGYRHYYAAEAGYKYNMMDLQAAIGIEQLRKIDIFWKRRETIWRRYQQALSNLPLHLPSDPDPSTRHAYHLYTILIDEAICNISRDDFINAMTAQNIGVGVHYLSIPEHRAYQTRYSWNPADYPNATRIGRQTVSLPITSKMTDEDIEDVINAVKHALAKTEH